MSLKLYFVSATQKDPTGWESTPLCKSIDAYEKQERPKPTFQQITYENDYSIAAIYNRAINAHNKDCILVFVHDDVSIEDIFFREKLEAALKDHDIVGLAGSRSFQPKDVGLWHLGSDRKDHSGVVWHPCNQNQIFATAFGPTPARCLVMDGLFLAVKCSTLLNSGLRFDESNPARFHFYDLDFCLEANKRKLKMTTAPIHAVHQSPGLQHPDEEFIKGNEWFLKKWGFK